MPFFRRKPEPKPYNAEEIKQAVAREELPTASMSPPVQPMQSNPPQMHYEKPMFQEDIHIPDTAPLFVKIERYREIVASLNESKRFLSSMKQMFLVMNELQGIQQDSMNMLKASIQRLEKSLEWIDQSLLRPAGFEEMPHGELEVKQIETSLVDLQREIESLRRDLEKIK